MVNIFHPKKYLQPSLFAITEWDVMSSESVALINHLSLMYARYKKFNVNPAEFACMKAIVLFKSGKITISLFFKIPFIRSKKEIT